MATTLRDYLISLGFTINEDQYKKWVGAVATSAKTVTGLGAAAITAATAIGIMTEKIARNFSDLYYAAQRNETTVAGLQRIQYGMSQIGLSAEKGRTAVENLGMAMQKNVALAGLVKQYTGETDPAKALPKLVDFLRAKYGPSAIGRQNALIELQQLFNQDYETALSLWQNNDRFKAQTASREKMEQKAGVDPDRLAKESRDFISQVDQLLEKLSILKDRVVGDLIEPAGKVVKAIDWLVDKFTEANKQFNGTLATALVKGGPLALAGTYAEKKINEHIGDGGMAAFSGSALSGTLLRLVPVLGGLLALMEDKVGDKDFKEGWLTGAAKDAPAFQGPMPAKRGGRAIPSSSKVWGDDEAIAAGIYDAPALKGGGGGNTVNLNQKNEINIAPGPTANETANRTRDKLKEYGNWVRDFRGNDR